MRCGEELQARADACVSQCSDVTTVAAAWRAFSSSLGTVVTVFRSLDAALRVGLDSIYCVGTTCLRRSLDQRGLYEPITRELVQRTRARLDEEAMNDCRACVECLQALDWYASNDSEGPYLEELVLRDARDLLHERGVRAGAMLSRVRPTRRCRARRLRRDVPLIYNGAAPGICGCRAPRRARLSPTSWRAAPAPWWTRRLVATRRPFPY